MYVQRNVDTAQTESSNKPQAIIKVFFGLVFVICFLVIPCIGAYIFLKKRRVREHQHALDPESSQRAVDDITRTHQQEEENRRAREEVRLDRETEGGFRGQEKIGRGRRSVEDNHGGDIGEERLQFEEPGGEERKDPFGDENDAGHDQEQFEIGSDSGGDEAYDSDEAEYSQDNELQFEDEFEPGHERKNPFGDENRVRG